MSQRQHRKSASLVLAAIIILLGVSLALVLAFPNMSWLFDRQQMVAIIFLLTTAAYLFSIRRRLFRVAARTDGMECIVGLLLIVASFGWFLIFPLLFPHPGKAGIWALGSIFFIGIFVGGFLVARWLSARLQ
jgi:hypothetical protein